MEYIETEKDRERLKQIVAQFKSSQRLEDALLPRRAYQKSEESKAAEEKKCEPSNGRVVAVDFDGTCVTHEFPDIGLDVPYCVEVLKRLEANNVKIILWTMRHGRYLQDAVDWFAKKNIPLWGINKNPEQSEWTQSPKCYAPIYIDDAALGCPLKPSYEGGRPMVDWQAIEKLLQERNFV